MSKAGLLNFTVVKQCGMEWYYLMFVNSVRI